MKIPSELRRSIPPVVQELADGRIVSFVVAVMLVPCLYGSPRFPNGWIRYLPAFIGPLLTTAFFFVRLWNPYKSYFTKRNGYGEEAVKDDPATTTHSDDSFTGREVPRSPHWADHHACVEHTGVHSCGLSSTDEQLELLSRTDTLGIAPLGWCCWVGTAVRSNAVEHRHMEGRNGEAANARESLMTVLQRRTRSANHVYYVTS
jgi:hypothetical protein